MNHPSLCCPQLCQSTGYDPLPLTQMWDIQPGEAGHYQLLALFCITSVHIEHRWVHWHVEGLWCSFSIWFIPILCFGFLRNCWVSSLYYLLSTLAGCSKKKKKKDLKSSNALTHTHTHSVPIGLWLRCMVFSGAAAESVGEGKGPWGEQSSYLRWSVITGLMWAEK